MRMVDQQGPNSKKRKFEVHIDEAHVGGLLGPCMLMEVDTSTIDLRLSG